jgi:hypothetical protein
VRAGGAPDRPDVTRLKAERRGRLLRSKNPHTGI